MGTYRVNQTTTIQLSSAQEYFVEALDIEVFDAKETHNTDTGAIRIVEYGEDRKTFKVSLTDLGIALIAAMDAKAEQEFNKKLLPRGLIYGNQ